jgi:hypothetical protein
MSTTILDIEQVDIQKASNKVELVIPYRLGAPDLTVYVHFKGESFGYDTLKVVPIYINPEEYALWTTDDDYMLDLICSKANITRLPPTPEPAPEPTLSPVEDSSDNVE